MRTYESGQRVQHKKTGKFGLIVTMRVATRQFLVSWDNGKRDWYSKNDLRLADD